MSKKINILFVVADFFNAGAQRYAFEIDSALNKEKHCTTILSLSNLESTKVWTDYYYPKHVNLNSKVAFLSDVGEQGSVSKKTLLKLLGMTKLHKKNHCKITNNLGIKLFLESFDVINWIGEYTVPTLRDIIDEAIIKRSVVHIMCAKFQNSEIYKSFPTYTGIRFMSGLEDDTIQYELDKFQNYTHIYFPLSLNVENIDSNNWKFAIGHAPKRIGIFTRLNFWKPIEPFIYAFHLILDSFSDAQLHLFGNDCDPEKQRVQRLIQHLGMEESVFIRGQQPDIKYTAIKENLDLAWFQGYRNRSMGYAGLDICLSGVPQLFWDFARSNDSSTKSSDVFPTYKNLRLFVDKSLEMLTNEGEANKLSEKQFNYVLNNHDIKKWVPVVENLFEEIAADA